MKKCIFALLFSWFAVAGWSQVSFLDTTYFSHTDEYVWDFYKNLQTFVSVNDNLFVKEEESGLKYLNTLDTISGEPLNYDFVGILEINLTTDNPGVISVVFLCQDGKTFLLHFCRDNKKTFIVKEKISIDLVLTNETNENGDRFMEIRETAMFWKKQDITKYQIMEQVRKKFF